MDFKVTGRHIAAANLLACKGIFMPAASPPAAAVQARVLPALKQQLASIARWQAEAAASAAAATAAEPLQISDIHMELLYVFAGAEVPYRDIHSFGSFNALLSYLKQLAARLPGQAACWHRIKPIAPGQWLVLTGSRGA
jgi:hypothetical protein